jgi:radical SAM protein with 4Fe4S-binding SPASM domain
MTDISPQLYQRMLSHIAKVQNDYDMFLRVRCAPPFAIAQGMDSSPPGIMSVGCLAGTYYCRITPEGLVTPCPYLPIELGSVKKDHLARIWKTSKVLVRLQNPMLKGRCGRCEHAAVCGGCRARAYAVKGGYLAEDPWCLHRPMGGAPEDVKDRKVVWSEEAEKRNRMARVPPFLRSVIAKRVELYAAEKGVREVTPEILREVRERWMDREWG